MSDVFVQFRVGADRYALDVRSVLEVTTLPATTPLPGSRPELMGLVALRGRVLPVFDAGECLHSGGERMPARIVVVEDGDLCAGLAVDEVVEIGPLPDAAESDDPLLGGAALTGDALVGIVDVEKLLAGLAR